MRLPILPGDNRSGELRGEKRVSVSVSVMLLNIIINGIVTICVESTKGEYIKYYSIILS
jgi:hypothetical protein